MSLLYGSTNNHNVIICWKHENILHEISHTRLISYNILRYKCLFLCVRRVISYDFHSLIKYILEKKGSTPLVWVSLSVSTSVLCVIPNSYIHDATQVLDVIFLIHFCLRLTSNVRLADSYNQYIAFISRIEDTYLYRSTNYLHQGRHFMSINKQQCAKHMQKSTCTSVCDDMI